jgi:hypothetical protein
MKPTGPVITLLAGLGLASVLFALSANANKEDKEARLDAGGGTPVSATVSPAVSPTGSADAPTTTTGAEPEVSPSETAPPPETTTKAAAPAAVKPNVTWAGKVGQAKATIAISARNGGAVAYFCDGKKIEGWFLGTAIDGKLDLSGGTGDKISGTFGNGRAKGTVTVRGKSWTFDVAAVKKPSGLYRSSAKVRGAKVVGGWIVLEDGSQVGVLNRGGVEVPAPPIDVDAGTVTVDGQSLPAAQVDGSIS